MANQNIRTTRFYPDLINYHRARGSSIGTVAATDAGAYKIGVQAGSADELFDLRPLNQVTFDTSADTDGHVLVNVNFTTASYKQTYIAILNHNLATAVGKIRIFAGNENVDHTALDGANADTGDITWANDTLTEVVNADTTTAASNDKSVVIEPASDGTTIVIFPEQDLRYWAIQFEGNTTNTGVATNGTWGSTDLAVGGIMIGEYYDMPHAPDLSVKRSIMYDHVDVQESLGGQRYSNATSFGRTASSTSKSPFALGTYGQAVYGGRQAFDLNFSYLNNTDLIPAETSVYQFADDTVVSDIWNVVDGSARPFIFSIDNTSVGANAESEHMFARFSQSNLDMTQVANDMYNVSMRIEEEF